MISVICPTIEGREEIYAKCKAAYEERTDDEISFITIFGEPTCGIAWQKGAEVASGQYLHFTADDLEPLEGWDIDARLAADDGILPAPVIYKADTGTVEPLGVMPDGFFTRIPFCSAEQWRAIGPMIPLHYYTDNWFSWRGSRAGYLTMEVITYRFKHHWAQRGRKHSLNDDSREYERYKRENYGG